MENSAPIFRTKFSTSALVSIMAEIKIGGKTRFENLLKQLFHSLLHTYIHTYIHKLYFSSNLRVAIIKANISEKTITKVTKYTTTLLTTILLNMK